MIGKKVGPGNAVPSGISIVTMPAVRATAKAITPATMINSLRPVYQRGIRCTRRVPVVGGAESFPGPRSIPALTVRAPR